MNDSIAFPDAPFLEKIGKAIYLPIRSIKSCSAPRVSSQPLLEQRLSGHHPFQLVL